MQWWRALPARVSRESFGFVACAATFAILTAILGPLLGTDQLLNVALVYLLVALIGAAIWGYRVGLASAVAANILVNLFFVPPIDRLSVQQPKNVIALVLFMAVAAIGAAMLALLRRQLLLTEARRAENAMLLDLSHALAHASTPRAALEAFCSAAAKGLGARGCSILRASPSWTVAATTGQLELSKDDEAMASEALRSQDIVRAGEMPRRRPGRHEPIRGHLTFVPFTTPEQGCLRVLGTIHLPALVDEGRAAFAGEASLSLQRARLAEEATRVAALQRADELKTALLSSISHDLRTPLTAIKASVGSLRDRDIQWSEDDTSSFLATIESETDRLAETVTNLLEMSRLEGGATHARLEPVAVAPLVDEVIAATQAVTAGRNVESCIEPGLGIRADYMLVLRALVNLVENAAKYSTPGEPIRIAGSGRGAVVRIEVSDTGPGIPAADLPHIFEKLYRGSQVGQIRGSGLGLSIVEAMVKLSGGRVHVRSAPDGTTFAIELPSAQVPG